MTRTKSTVRWIPQVVVNPPGHIGNKNNLNRRPRNMPFKIEKLLPQSKCAEVKKRSNSLENECQKRKASISLVEDAYSFNIPFHSISSMIFCSVKYLISNREFLHGR